MQLLGFIKVLFQHFCHSWVLHVFVLFAHIQKICKKTEEAKIRNGLHFLDVIPLSEHTFSDLLFLFFSILSFAHWDGVCFHPTAPGPHYNYTLTSGPKAILPTLTEVRSNWNSGGCSRSFSLSVCHNAQTVHLGWGKESTLQRVEHTLLQIMGTFFSSLLVLFYLHQLSIRNRWLCFQTWRE